MIEIVFEANTTTESSPSIIAYHFLYNLLCSRLTHQANTVK